LERLLLAHYTNPIFALGLWLDIIGLLGNA
jgi:hypothetical protein